MPPHHSSITVAGKVTDLFGHRFVVETDEGRLLADLGPKGAEAVQLAVGDAVTLTGEQKPSELKVSELKLRGRVVSLHPKPPHADEHAEETALAAVKAIGFTPVGRPERHPKHFEITARRGDEALEFHVEFDGAIRKTKPAKPHKRGEKP